MCIRDRHNISLKPYNSFGIDVRAKTFIKISGVNECEHILEEKGEDTLVLGGGSNILFTKNYDGLIIKNEISGIEKIEEDEGCIYIKAGAGVVWHQFVLYCIKNNYAGVENLALIPGCVGASPIQNIGAYGAEIRQVVHTVETFHKCDKAKVNFSNKDCAFGYRDSIFKNKYKNQLLITSVTYRLFKKPVFNISYGAIEKELANMGVQDLNITAIAHAVINIRSSKLPDPAQIGNAGSFFKNPEIEIEEFNTLKNNFPEIVGFALPGNKTKLAAGWLIEQCGWKGFRRADAGCHKNQALVLVNYGTAKGEEILQLSNEIIASVQQKFGVILEREVNII
ncbi:MAG TPA: UDP-N-acetylenolpyruvoylglucosamine reductase [Chitinophagaceae bacterium]|nr:UDP-N-acetylenolpyruvoylglucosamine reductase [Chitinophagaceae bacterium]